ncbi:MAG TPA: HD domain-containing protein [Terriglobales bacterium]|nr:HD domain-containing protein [Terriglobales bacterium]
MRDASVSRLGQRFRRALLLAAELHADQVKKGGHNIPYISHLLGVTSLVIEFGGDEDMAIAALLHDAVEDQGGRPTLERIRADYGNRVAHIVEGCTDSEIDPKPPWLERKQAYVRHVREHADSEVTLVSTADKLHNVRAILADFRELGDPVFDRFKGRKDGTLWYYRAMVDAFRDAMLRNGLTPYARGNQRLLDELDRELRALESGVAGKR